MNALARPPNGEDTVVIVQPCFLPWRGQFDLMSRASTVVFLDTVQFVRRSWYNRNRIMTANGPAWLTIPVVTKGRREALIKDIAIADEDRDWRPKVVKSLERSYGRYPHAEPYLSSLTSLLGKPWNSIANLSRATVEWGFGYLGRAPKFLNASELAVEAESATDRLVWICRALGARRYLSGPSAKGYIGAGEAFTAAGIQLEWMTYDYPEYPQVRRTDTPLAIIDLFCNVGEAAPRYIWN